MSGPNYNVLFNVTDIGARTYGGLNDNLPTTGYSLVGRNSVDALANKTLISSIISDLTNDVAANKIRIGSTILPITTTAPTDGQTLTYSSSGNNLVFTTASVNFNPPTQTLSVFIDKSGNDTTGDGTIYRPYLTITKAYTSIGDASTTKRYIIHIGGGRYDETGDIVIKPWTWLIGSQRTATRITSATNIVRLDSSFASGSYRFGLLWVVFSGSTNVNFDLQALGGSGSTVFECDALYVNNAFTFKGRTSADFTEMWNSQLLGTSSFYSLSGLLKNCYCGGIVLTDAGGTENMFFDMFDNQILGNLSVTQTRSNTYQSNIANNYVTGTVTLTSNGSLQVLIDSASFPSSGTISTSGALTLTRTTPAAGVSYSAGTPANWAVSAPVNVSSAIDRIAAAVVTLRGSAIP